MQQTLEFSATNSLMCDTLVPSSQLLDSRSGQMQQTSSINPRLAVTQYIEQSLSSPGPYPQNTLPVVHSLLKNRVDHLYRELNILSAQNPHLLLPEQLTHMNQRFSTDIDFTINFLTTHSHDNPANSESELSHSIARLLRGLQLYQCQQLLYIQQQLNATPKLDFARKLQQLHPNGRPMVQSIMLNSTQHAQQLGLKSKKVLQFKDAVSVINGSEEQATPNPTGLVNSFGSKLSGIKQSDEAALVQDKLKLMESEVASLRSQNDKLRSKVEESKLNHTNISSSKHLTTLLSQTSQISQMLVPTNYNKLQPQQLFKAEPTQEDILKAQNESLELRMQGLMEQNAQLREILYRLGSQSKQDREDLIARFNKQKQAYQAKLQKLKRQLAHVQAQSGKHNPVQQSTSSPKLFIPLLELGGQKEESRIGRPAPQQSSSRRTPKLPESNSQLQAPLSTSKINKEQWQQIKLNPVNYTSDPSTLSKLLDLVQEYAADLEVKEQQNLHLKQLVIDLEKKVEQLQTQIGTITNRGLTQRDEALFMRVVQQLELEKQKNVSLKRELQKQSGSPEYQQQQQQEVTDETQQAPSGRSYYANHHYEDNGEIDTLRYHLRRLQQQQPGFQRPQHRNLSRPALRIYRESGSMSFQILMSQMERKLVTLSSVVIPDLESQLLKYQRLCEQSYLELQCRQLENKELRAQILVLQTRLKNTSSVGLQRYKHLTKDGSKTGLFKHPKSVLPRAPERQHIEFSLNRGVRQTTSQHQIDTNYTPVRNQCNTSAEAIYKSNSKRKLNPVNSKTRLQLMQPMNDTNAAYNDIRQMLPRSAHKKSVDRSAQQESGSAYNRSHQTKQTQVRRQRIMRLDELINQPSLLRLRDVIEIIQKLHTLFSKMAKSSSSSNSSISILVPKNIYVTNLKNMSNISSDAEGEDRLKLKVVQSDDVPNKRYVAPELLVDGEADPEATIAWNLGMLIDDLMHTQQADHFSEEPRLHPSLSKPDIDRIRHVNINVSVGKEEDVYDFEPLSNLIRDLTNRDPSARLSMQETKSILDNEEYKLIKSSKRLPIPAQ